MELKSIYGVKTMFIRDEHAERLPTVRIHKAVLRHFKSVDYGEITFDCAKQFIPMGTKSDILGIYGQNGSGKTAFIEAISILKSVMEGSPVSPFYADFITKGADHAEFEFTFNLQYPTKPITVRKVVYCFSIRVNQLDDINPLFKEVLTAIDLGEVKKQFDSEVYKRKIVIYNERLSIGGDIDGEKKKLQLVIDTSVDKGVFGPASKRKLFYKAAKKTVNALEVNKQLAMERSQSFIFCDDTLQLFISQENQTLYQEVLYELNLFANHFLSVIDTKATGMIQLNYGVPIWLEPRRGVILIETMIPVEYSLKKFNYIKGIFASMSNVLCQLIPGMRIDLKEVSKITLPDGSEGKKAEVIINRNGIELPLRCVSDGARKIISMLGLLIAAYNEKSVTIAIDEFDAGVFEYLLGEILQIFEESGKGQLIFTSHNLRPLEVIDKNFIYFTTTNPDNRYIRFKNVGITNNLRNLYFREILLGEQDEEIYKATKKQKIVSAFRKAGE